MSNLGTKPLRKLLKEQLETSKQYALSIGADKKPVELIDQVGESFKDVCKDLLHSDSICALLFSQLDAMGQSMPGIFVSRLKYTNEPATAQNIIFDNFDAFLVPMVMFYFGLNIGKALQLEEVELLKSIEPQIPTPKPQKLDEKALKTALEKDLVDFLGKTFVEVKPKSSKKKLSKGDEGDIQKIEGGQL